MNLMLFIIVAFLLQAACLYVGSRSTKGLKDHQDYFLAGKKLGFFSLMMTCVATQVGGGFILGASDEAYRYGLNVLLYPAGGALGMIILGLGVGKRLYNLNVSTVADVFLTRYNSKALKTAASLLSIISLFMILVAQFIASSKFMASFGLESRWLFIGFWGLVITYTTLGGFKAVVDTDIVQALFFAAIFFFSFIWILTHEPAAITQITNSIQTPFADSSSKIFGWLILPLAFMFFEQDMAQRCFAGKNSKTVSTATFTAGIVTLLICFIPVLLGVLGKMKGIQVEPGKSVLMTVIEQLTNPYIMAFVAAAIFAAIISTADSLINAISSNVAQDFDFSFIKANEVRISQLITGTISITGLLFSFYFTNIVDILMQSYELSVSCLFVPIFFVLFTKRSNTLSATLSMVFGALSFLILHIYPLDFPRELCSILSSFLGYGAGELLVSLKPHATLQKAE